MDIETTRFGRLSVEDDRIITFPNGLLGFPDHTQFALIQTGEENYFFWLQSVNEPNLAFVVTDPTIFFKEYQVPVREETWQDLQLADENALQCFVICNKVGDWLTGNLLGPIVVNAQNRLGQQIVLTEKKWTTRQPLMMLQTEVAPLAKSAYAGGCDRRREGPRPGRPGRYPADRAPGRCDRRARRSPLLHQGQRVPGRNGFKPEDMRRDTEVA